ncbi:toxin-antitoxin system HicB family antitoxin, partial [Enterobacter hormaechei]|nr:toxin-antitoxin system HicB family antitoxin [Enterobacter hormaechei]
MSTAKRDPNQSKSGKAPTFQIRITPELKAQF